MDTQTQNNIRGMRLPDSPPDELGDDLIFDPVLERKRIADGTEEYLEELRRDWEKYAFGKNSFPEKISKISSALREWMLSFDRTNFYDRLAREFGLQESDRMGIARIAWDIVLKSDWSPLTELFQKHISQASVVPEISKRFATDFIPKARELSLMADARPNASLSSASRSVPTEQKTVDRVEISLMQALGKFEKLGGQQVTNSKIVVKGQNDPVRPTIFNWLRAYRDELGVGAHDAVARGQFLFHSVNAKGLSADERDQVGMLLKSLDENSPLTIDAGRQEVVFQRTTVVPPAGGVSAVRGAVLEPNTFQTAVAPLQKRNDRSQIQNSGLRQPTDPKAERPSFANQNGNISRAVFDLPVMRHESNVDTNSGRTRLAGEVGRSTSGTTAPANRPSAFEQAKAIQEANRASRVSMTNPVSQTVELGAIHTVLPDDRLDSNSLSPRQSKVSSSNENMSAPRAISFEPAKIDAFSFGESPAPSAPLPIPSQWRTPVSEQATNNNVGELSFSTKHVMPAEKEGMARTTTTMPLDGAPAVRGQEGGKNTSILQAPKASVQPAKKAPTAQQINRYRITPTGRRDVPTNDDMPSPHVVDLRS